MENIVLEWLVTYSKTDFMKKLRSGKLIGEIVKVMRDKMDGRLYPDRKMFAFFSHEQTLIDFFHTLGMKNLFKPSYGAAAFVELHKIKEEFYVKVIIHVYGYLSISYKKIGRYLMKIYFYSR